MFSLSENEFMIKLQWHKCSVSNIYFIFDYCFLLIRFLLRVQELVEEEGPAILCDFDDKGHTPVHWAALGGHTNILRFMVQCKVPLGELLKKPYL